MIFLSPAKLNLVLKIKGRDPKDGYHLIESVFDPISLYDVLDVEITQKRAIQVIDKFKKLGIKQDKNIIYKAVKMMADKYKIDSGIKIELYKHIPNGAGMGGGSSNAATAILAINRLLGLKLSVAEMSGIGYRCGADVPFFIQAKAAFVTGKGEKIGKYDRKKEFWYVVAVHKDIKVRTNEAYKWFDGEINLTNDKSYTNIIYGYRNSSYAFLYNDFESVIYKRYPVLKSIKEYFLLQDCVDASLSGSGSAVFAMFDRRQGALDCFKKTRLEWKGSFVGLAHSI
jgi:4-diphosphocytidyl-2-C-methyl-D-erythritol kinase